MTGCPRIVVLAALALWACAGGSRRGTSTTAAPVHEQLVAAAIAAGDLDSARGRIERALDEHPRDLGLRSWRVVLAVMEWRDIDAVTEIEGLLSHGEMSEERRIEVQRQAGHLLFQAGRWSDSMNYLEGLEDARSVAMLRVASRLPPEQIDVDLAGVELPLLDEVIPTLECRVEGRLLPFVLDTGASLTTVSKGPLPSLEEVTDAGTASDGAGRQLTTALGLLPGLALSTVDVGRIPVVVVDDETLALPREPIGDPAEVVGLLGLDVLSRFRTTFDPTRRSVILEAPRGLPETDSVATVRSEGRLLVPVRIDGRSLWFAVDTGASHSSLTPAGLRELPGGLDRARPTQIRVHGPAGSELVLREVRDVVVEVDAARFPGISLPVVHRVVTRLMPVHGVLGADLLFRGRTTLDRGRLRIVPA